jgi:hypothetical protein
MILHAPDNFLRDEAQAPSLMRLLASLGPKVKGVELTTLAFGSNCPNNKFTSPPPSAAEALCANQFRSCCRLIHGRFIPVVNPLLEWVTLVHRSFLIIRITRHTSHATRHTSHVTRHTSHVTRHTCYVTRHTSHVFQLSSFIQRSFRWHSCYATVV